MNSHNYKDRWHFVSVFYTDTGHFQHLKERRNVAGHIATLYSLGGFAEARSIVKTILLFSSESLSVANSSTTWSLMSAVSMTTPL